MLMKNIFLTLGFLLSAIITSAQYKEADLEGKEWITSEENDFNNIMTITRVFTSNTLHETVEIKGTNTSKSEQEYKWYLSNKTEDSFDENKIGKNTTGNYLVIRNFNNSAFVCKIVELTTEKMIILPATQKNSIRIASVSVSPIVFIRKK